MVANCLPVRKPERHRAYRRMSLRIPRRMLHQSAPQRLESLTVTLALPVIPGRQPPWAGRQQPSLRRSGLSRRCGDGCHYGTYRAPSRVASGRRRAREPWPDQGASCSRRARSGSPRNPISQPQHGLPRLATQRPTSSSGRGVMTVPRCPVPGSGAPSPVHCRPGSRAGSLERSAVDLGALRLGDSDPEPGPSAQPASR